MIEIRWHGRGGQGAITAAKIVAQAAFKADFGGVIMAPTFGTERRGAPVHTSLKISKEKINDLSPIESPDIVVVLDHLILEEGNVTAGLKPNGRLILNTPKPIESYSNYGFKLAVANVSAIAAEAGLKKGIVNSGMIGVFSKASGILGLEELLPVIENEFTGKRPLENAEAARRCYEQTVLRG